MDLVNGSNFIVGCVGMFFEIMQDFVIVISMKPILSSVGTKLSLLLFDRNI